MATDQIQQKALNALEPYVLLSNSAASPRAAADLITQATSASNTYVFAELLQTPNIQALGAGPPEYAPFLTLLEVFSWGTWTDYTSTPSLPRLSKIQALKLRQLTLLSLSTSHSTLTYSHLAHALAMPSVRDLEDLVISSIYAGLLTAKLDPLAQYIEVSSVSPLRDLKPASIPHMTAILSEWDSRCTSVLEDLDAQIKDIRRRAAEKRRRDTEHERIYGRAVGDDGLGGGGKGGKAAGKRGVGEVGNGEGYEADQGEAMEIDEGMGRTTRSYKRGGGRFAQFGRRFN